MEVSAEARKQQRLESRRRRSEKRSAAFIGEETAALAERKLQAGDSDVVISEGRKRQRQAEALGATAGVYVHEALGAADEAAEKKPPKKEKKAVVESEEEDELEAAEAAVHAANEKLKLLKAEAEVNAAKEKLKRLKEKKIAKAKAAEDDGEAEPEEAIVDPARRKGRVCRAEAQADAVASEEAPAAVDQAVEKEDKLFTAFVGGLPSHVDESYIKRDFGERGKITNIVLAKWPEDGSSKGIAFITFATEQGLNNCVAWNGEIYENKPLRIEKKEGKDKPKQQKDRGLGGQRGVKPEGCLSVAVLDMSKTATEEDLRTFFAKCGAISEVRILKHRETFESRGIAFVKFEDTSATDEAILLSEKKLAGKPARIEYAAPKNDTDFKGRAKGKGKGGSQEKPEGCVAVVVRNLSLNASEDELWRLFKGCPSATNISILPGMAFVDFDDTNDTDVAVKLSGREIQGQAVSVTFKMPKR